MLRTNRHTQLIGLAHALIYFSDHMNMSTYFVARSQIICKHQPPPKTDAPTSKECQNLDGFCVSLARDAAPHFAYPDAISAHMQITIKRLAWISGKSSAARRRGGSKHGEIIIGTEQQRIAYLSCQLFEYILYCAITIVVTE